MNNEAGIPHFAWPNRLADDDNGFDGIDHPAVSKIARRPG
jgi:hypothetical protein